MTEYETDPRREPADSAADQPHPTAELSRADRGQSDSTDATAPGSTGDAGIVSPAPAGPYPPSPWQPGYDQAAHGQPAHGQAAQPGRSSQPGWSGSGYPGAGPGHSGGAPVGYPTSGPTGYPSSGASGYPSYPTSGPTGYPPSGASGYPTSGATGYPGTAPSGYPGGTPSGGYPAGGAQPGQPGYGGPPQPWEATQHPGAARPSVPGRIGRAVLFGVLALVLLTGTGIAGGVIALALDDDTSGGGTRTYTAAPIINSADLPGIAAAVQDSVVSISTGNSEGSGVVLTPDGFVLTNNHVVAGAQGGGVRVVFADGKNVDAEVVGTDPPTDLAVLKAQGVSGLTAARFGDSDAMRVGDTVLALGSPLGLQGSVTAGIISARDRSIATGGEPGGVPRQGASSITGLLQTDAPINPGNSGGALVNTNGEVIGINTAIATSGQSNGNIGVGFAIPSNRAKSVAEALRRGEKVSHPYLGVSVTTREEGGALVGSVTPGSPAEKAGLRQGDVITRFGDQTVAESNDLVAAVQAGKVGDRVEVTYLRNGTENRATVTLAETS